MRHARRSDGGNKKPFAGQTFGQRDGRCCTADNNRHDLRFGTTAVDSQLRKPVAKLGGIALKQAAAFGFLR